MLDSRLITLSIFLIDLIEYDNIRHCYRECLVLSLKEDSRGCYDSVCELHFVSHGSMSFTCCMLGAAVLPMHSYFI